MNNQINCIMLIDDNFHDNFFHKKAIEDAGITAKIEVATFAEDALTYLKNEKSKLPQLVFLDLNMPRMNGWEFLEEFKTLNIKEDITFIILSTSDYQNEKTKALLIDEVAGYETKPLTALKVKKIMQKYFNVVTT